VRFANIADNAEMLTKICKDCACSLPISEFSLDPKAKPDGKSKGTAATCRFCKAIRRKIWKLRNVDKERTYRRERKRRLRAKARELNGPYIGPMSLKEKDPIAWKAKKRWEKRAYKTKLVQAKPAWADNEDISMWYEVAEVLSRSGVKFEVDHIVPLRSKFVCGLHAHTNLQVLPAYLNHAKGNRRWPDMP
jgi:hypothetical protein